MFGKYQLVPGTFNSTCMSGVAHLNIQHDSWQGIQHSERQLVAVVP